MNSGDDYALLGGLLWELIWDVYEKEPIYNEQNNVPPKTAKPKSPGVYECVIW